MNTESTRQYSLPRPLSNTTTTLIKLAHQQPLVIPDAQELLSIKADLEVLLPLAENRAQDLKRGLNKLDGNVKIYDNGEVNAENTKIKQESDDYSDSLFIPKNDQQSRQAALEAIRRRRRREDTESADEARRSESPHLKMKRMEPLQRQYAQSMSPPTLHNDLKKKKQASPSVNARAQQDQSKEELDFVRVKPKDQVPIATFWAAMEPYFRPLTEEDRQFLLEKSDTGKPFLIPPLGEHYLDQWAREDQLLQQQTKSPLNSRHSSVDPQSQQQQQQQQQKLRYVKEPITDDQLLQDDLTSGSLTERLLSSLVAEDIIDPSELKREADEGEAEENTEDQDTQNKSVDRVLEIVDFEERLKRELRYAGLFGDDDVDWNAREDDEICAELRALGREYKEQLKINDYRKKRLLEIVDCQLQYEQYRQVLDTLDNQVEQGYIKRFRNQKSKKRKATSGQKSTLSENAIYAMEKRRTWINALGEIFKDKNLVMPSKSIYSPEPSATTTDENDNNNNGNNNS
ncbi:hypothetical protein G6F70_005260 [Rhizopus microsporus]|nr:hypothetical protein G6F71_005739 [Rhizopus microsporus]KAG1199048.1 hypothetical protein G6F70_005260 [Rhizopus microsporus]KAG1212302.1 hypothetical protein G6F69_003828 [Rhizopus microsporus]KAG1234004.1 hypothetical protein G6F67_003852 [Rhizopus microsporus]KAG1266462.1 hypothetical protein G6F68_002737 [Rhizopus microsporus]